MNLQRFFILSSMVLLDLYLILVSCQSKEWYLIHACYAMADIFSSPFSRHPNIPSLLKEKEIVKKCMDNVFCTQYQDNRDN